MNHPKKIKNITAMKAPERYEYFVRKTVDFEKVWGLYEDGWAVAEDSKGHKAIPFWPEKEFAEVCCDAVWKSYEPKAIDLESFLERWIPGMEDDEMLVAVFPTPADNGIFVSAAQLGADLSGEIEQYE